ncbi:MAG TPA: alanine racemase, partial [Candidatus Paceibacterota bacterium]
MKKPIIQKKEAASLIKRHGSPLYVYRKKIVQQRYNELKGAITYPKTRIFYACKANANAEILKLLLKLGSAIECVSRGEVERALAVGFPKDRISYTCSNIPKEELAWLIKKGISVHLDSLNQVEWWGQLKPGSEISVRLNLGYGDGGHKYLITGGDDSKFGIYHADIPKLHRIAKKYNLRIKGILQHIGTHIADPNSLLRGMELVFAIAKEFPELQFVDFGGGFNTPYRPTEKQIDVKKIGGKMSGRFEKFCSIYGRQL